MIVFQQQTTSDVLGVEAQRIMTNSEWLVRVMGTGPSFVPIQAVASRVDALLHRASGAAPNGGLVGACWRVAPFRLVEDVEGVQVRHLGGIFRVHVEE
jgi:hypothetical protein